MAAAVGHPPTLTSVDVRVPPTTTTTTTNQSQGKNKKKQKQKQQGKRKKGGAQDAAAAGYGADVCRIWAASSNFVTDVTIGATCVRWPTRWLCPSVCACTSACVPEVMHYYIHSVGALAQHWHPVVGVGAARWPRELKCTTCMCVLRIDRSVQKASEAVRKIRNVTRYVRRYVAVV